jgi:hypothetical protein
MGDSEKKTKNCLTLRSHKTRAPAISLFRPVDLSVLQNPAVIVMLLCIIIPEVKNLNDCKETDRRVCLL